MSDTLQYEMINTAFNLGFDYGSKWFVLYLVVVVGVFIYKIMGKI